MDASRMPRPTNRLRICHYAAVNATRYGTAAHAGAALRIRRYFRRAWGLCVIAMLPLDGPRRPPHRAVVDGPGGCAICGWRFGTTGCFARCGGRAFRWLRPAGVSPVATGDQRRCLWTPRFFEKKRVKLLTVLTVTAGAIQKNGAAAAAPSGYVIRFRNALYYSGQSHRQ